METESTTNNETTDDGVVCRPLLKENVDIDDEEIEDHRFRSEPTQAGQKFPWSVSLLCEVNAIPIVLVIFSSSCGHCEQHATPLEPLTDQIRSGYDQIQDEMLFYTDSLKRTRLCNPTDMRREVPNRAHFLQSYLGFSRVYLQLSATVDWPQLRKDKNKTND
eukprot:339834-Hanusia_phi.AAC.1